MLVQSCDNVFICVQNEIISKIVLCQFIKLAKVVFVTKGKFPVI